MFLGTTFTRTAMASSCKHKDTLLNAIEDDDTDLAIDLIKNGHSTEGEYNEEYTPLHVAVMKNNTYVCRELLAAKAHINAYDKFGCTPLIRASHAGTSLEIVKILVASGADVKLTTPSSVSAIHIAAKWSPVDKLRFLLDLPGANPSLTDVFSRTAIHYALGCSEGIEVAKIKVLLLLNSGVPINAQDFVGETALDYGYNLCPGIGLLTFLFHYGANPAIRDRKGDNYLNRHMKLEKNYQSDFLLQEFLSNGLGIFSKEAVRSMINNKGSGGYTPFHRACGFLLCPVEEIEQFFKSGADVTIPNDLGKTPLHLASREFWIACPGVVEFLLKNGAPVNAKDIFGETPIYQMKSLPLVKVLLDFGADLRLKDKNGRPPLLALMKLKQPKVLQLLLDRGAAVNCTDDYGSTPLHYAAYFDNVEATRIILQHGGDLSAIDNFGMTPHDLATELGMCHVAEHLQNEIMTSKENPQVIYDRKELVFYNQNDHKKVQKSLVSAKKLKLIDYQLLEQKNQSIRDVVEMPEDFNMFAQRVLSAPGIGKVDNQEAVTVKTSVIQLMETICGKIKENDARFKITLVPTGSASEGMKVGEPDEFDFMCCLDEFTEICRVVEVPELDPFGFARLALEDTEKRIAFARFFRDDNSLWPEVVYEHFFFILDQVIQTGSTWTNKHLIFEERVYKLCDKPPFSLTITWIGARYKQLKISIDIVPAIRIKNWVPPSSFAAREERELPFMTKEIQSEGCFFLLQPTSPQFNMYEETVMRVSLAAVEIMYLRSLPEPVRLSYSLAKAMRNESVCPPVQFDINDFKFGAESVISSYMLKNCLFHAVELHSDELSKCGSETGAEDMASISRIWAIRIYEILRECCERGHLPVFFLRSQDVFTFSSVFMNDKEEKDIREEQAEQNRRRLVFISAIERLLGLQRFICVTKVSDP